jgi:hypothetical protein
MAGNVTYQTNVFGIFYCKRRVHSMNMISRVFVVPLNIASCGCVQLYSADFK